MFPLIFWNMGTNIFGRNIYVRSKFSYVRPSIAFVRFCDCICEICAICVRVRAHVHSLEGTLLI